MQRFAHLVDFHIVAMVVLLVPLAFFLALGAQSTRYPWLWFLCIPAFPQGTLLTRAIGLRRSNQSPVPYVVANELFLLIVTCLVVALSLQFLGHVQ